MIKVLIADDHAIVRAGLRTLIESDPNLELVGEASGGYETIELIDKSKPDILVLDISMPDIDGIALPGMPAGSPGMPGTKSGTWTIYSIKDGKTSEFMKY